MSFKALTVAVCMMLMQQAAALAETAKYDELTEAQIFCEDFTKKYVTAAINMVVTNKYAEALAQLETAQTKLAEKQYHSKDAISWKNRTLDSILRWRADAYKGLDKYDQAAKSEMKRYHLLHAENPRSGMEVINTAGEYFIEAKDYASAEATFEEALKDADDFEWVDSQKGLWITYLNQDKPDKVKASIAAASERIKKISNPKLTREFRFALVEIYGDLGDETSVKAVQAQLDSKNCPVCGSDKTIQPIMYGLPAKDAKEVDVHFGGCIVTQESPRWYCSKDKVEF